MFSNFGKELEVNFREKKFEKSSQNFDKILNINL